MTIYREQIVKYSALKKNEIIIVKYLEIEDTKSVLSISNSQNELKNLRLTINIVMNT